MFGQSRRWRLGCRYALQRSQKRSKRRRAIHHQQSYGTHRYNTGLENAQRAVRRHHIQRQCVFCRAFPQGLDKRLDYERLAHFEQGRSEKRRFVERTSLSYANSRSILRQSQRTRRQRIEQPLRRTRTRCNQRIAKNASRRTSARSRRNLKIK